ncbi:MAG: type II toxin-antitoxin system Phd/YefM family antitoxin [Planctomycetota bacterium]|nr:MAG: type II toxin-antitoxin system Phd/YefM family antitoxin [Planctomycetota bacterium]
MPTTQPVSYVKAHLAEVLDRVRESHDPITVTQNGSPSAVIVDHESYQRTQEALAILKLVAMGEKDLTARRTIPQKQVFADNRAKILAAMAQRDHA